MDIHYAILFSSMELHAFFELAKIILDCIMYVENLSGFFSINEYYFAKV